MLHLHPGMCHILHVFAASDTKTFWVEHYQWSKHIPRVGLTELRHPSSSTEKRGHCKGSGPIAGTPQAPLLKVEWMWLGQGGGTWFNGWAGPTPDVASGQGVQEDRGPVLTGVSAGGSLAPGRPGWALPWRQLEHLQVPLLILSPARGMQSKAEGL